METGSIEETLLSSPHGNATSLSVVLNTVSANVVQESNSLLYYLIYPTHHT